METLNLAIVDKCLDDLNIRFNNFSESSNVPPVEYDSSKLIEILRKKEIFEICDSNQEEYDFVNDIDIQLGKIVKDLVFSVDFDASIKEYNLFENRIENEVSNNLYLFAQQGLLSVKSLYYYRIENWDKAIAITSECIALNDFLVLKGMHTLTLRVYEQNKNISRILFRKGSMEEANVLLFNLFNYMLNGVNNGLHGSMFMFKDLWEKTPILRETYAYETFLMITEDIIKFNLHDKKEFFPCNWFYNLDFEVNNINRQTIYNWIYINKKLHDGDYEEFFKGFIYFFEESTSKYYDLFKIYLIIELIKLVNKLNYVNRDLIQEKAINFLTNKIGTNHRLKKKVIETYTT